MRLFRPFHRRIALGGCVLLALVTGFLLAAWVDHSWKQPPHAGYIPADAAWAVVAPDLPEFWRLAEDTPWGRSFRETTAPRLDEARRTLRRAIGFHPTPMQWRAWMGPNLWAGSLDGAWGICVRPGFLMHARHALHRLRRGAENAESIYAAGGVYYAWREGFLIVSASRQYVENALRAEPYSMTGPMTAYDGITFCWKGAAPGWALFRTVSPQVQGALLSPAWVPSRGLELAGTWPGGALCSIAMQMPPDSFAPLWAVLRGYPWAESLSEFQPFAARLLEHIHWPPAHSEGLREAAVALYLDDNHPAWPVPEIAAAFRTAAPPPEGAHPLQVSDTLEAMPHAWGERSGWILPIWGEAFTLCTAASGPYWVAATRESCMARVIGSPPLESAPRRVAVVRADWAQISNAIQILLRRGAVWRVIPQYNARDAENEIMPLLRVLAQWGALRVDCYAAGNTLRFLGDLAIAGGAEE